MAQQQKSDSEPRWSSQTHVPTAPGRVCSSTPAQVTPEFMWSSWMLTVTGEQHPGQPQCSKLLHHSSTSPCGSRSSPSTSMLCHCHQPSPSRSFESHFKHRFSQAQDHFSFSFFPEGDPGAFTLSTPSLQVQLMTGAEMESVCRTEGPSRSPWHHTAPAFEAVSALF